MDKRPYNQDIVKHSPKLITLKDLGYEDAVTPSVNNEPPAPPTDVDRQAVEIFLRDSELRGSSALFDVHTARDWVSIAAARSTPHMLFDTMWHEGELCILFADTNVGKSILAVQIADSISRGVPIPGLCMDAPAQPVAYFDFELSPKQFQMRYSHESGELHPFADTFYRAEMDMTASYVEWGYKSFEDFLSAELEKYIVNTRVKILIIDNITYLRSENEKAKDAFSLMSLLNTLKKKYGLSMLVLAHTPKRDQTRPLETNNLQGSKQLANLCDSIVAIGKSARDPEVRYVKQIKCRFGAKKYNEDNVCVFQIVKPHTFLHFEYMETATERQHLKELGDKEIGQRIASVKDLSAKGMSQREIALEMGISVGSVNRYLKRS